MLLHSLDQTRPCRRRFGVIEMCRIRLWRSKHLVNDEPLATMSVKNESACQVIARVSLPRPQLLAPARHAKDDRVISWPIIYMHFYAICADGPVRLQIGIIGERQLPFALAHCLDLMHVLIHVERVVTSMREIDRAL